MAHVRAGVDLLLGMPQVEHGVDHGDVDDLAHLLKGPVHAEGEVLSAAQHEGHHVAPVEFLQRGRQGKVGVLQGMAPQQVAQVHHLQLEVSFKKPVKLLPDDIRPPAASFVAGVGPVLRDAQDGQLRLFIIRETAGVEICLHHITDALVARRFGIIITPQLNGLKKDGNIHVDQFRAFKSKPNWE